MQAQSERQEELYKKGTKIDLMQEERGKWDTEGGMMQECDKEEITLCVSSGSLYALLLISVKIYRATES